MPFWLGMVLHTQNFQITNRQYFWKSDFFDFLQVVEATKICYFGLALSGIGSQPIRLSDVLKFKNSKTT